MPNPPQPQDTRSQFDDYEVYSLMRFHADPENSLNWDETLFAKAVGVLLATMDISPQTMAQLREAWHGMGRPVGQPPDVETLSEEELIWVSDYEYAQIAGPYKKAIRIALSAQAKIAELERWIGMTKNHAPYEAAGATWQQRHEDDQAKIAEMEEQLKRANS